MHKCELKELPVKGNEMSSPSLDHDIFLFA